VNILRSILDWLRRIFGGGSAPNPPPVPPSPEPTPAPEPPPSLPTNPALPPNTAGTNDQRWYFGWKDHDGTFRMRWPTYFWTKHAVGAGSYVLVNELRAEFRSYDTDGGAKRPSYSLPGPRSRVTGEVLCVLVSKDGERLAWFRTRSDATTQGDLP